MKEKLKKILQFIANPRLLLCILLGWLITNGWSYIFLAIGTYFKIEWMIGIASAYITFLWLPISPEKIITIAIAIALLRLLFPNDQKTLAVLKDLFEKTKISLKTKKQKKSAKKKETQNIKN